MNKYVRPQATDVHIWICFSVYAGRWSGSDSEHRRFDRDLFMPSMCLAFDQSKSHAKTNPSYQQDLVFSIFPTTKDPCCCPDVSWSLASFGRTWIQHAGRLSAT